VEERDWFKGYQGKTGMGEFIVLQVTPNGFLVSYTSGKWQGKIILMPKSLKGDISSKVKLNEDQMERVLGIIYERFTGEYDAAYFRLANKMPPGEEPYNDQVLNMIRKHYPAIYQECINDFLSSEALDS